MDEDRQDAATRDRLMILWAKAEVARLTNIRASQNRAKGVPGPEGSTGKLAFAENNKDIHEFNMELLGAQGMLYDTYSIERSAMAMGAASPSNSSCGQEPTLLRAALQRSCAIFLVSVS